VKKAFSSSWSMRGLEMASAAIAPGTVPPEFGIWGSCRRYRIQSVDDLPLATLWAKADWSSHLFVYPFVRAFVACIDCERAGEVTRGNGRWHLPVKWSVFLRQDDS
jgi:hypothetical protein